MKRRLSKVPFVQIALIFSIYLFCNEHAFNAEAIESTLSEKDHQQQQTIRELTGCVMPELKVFSLADLTEQTSLHKSIGPIKGIAVLAVIDDKLLDGHIQRNTFERLYRENNSELTVFHLLYLTKKPQQYLSYLDKSRSSPCGISAMQRNIFEKEVFNPEMRAMLLFLDSEYRMIKCLPSYCSYDALQASLIEASQHSELSGGFHQ